jgi:hypothetical protein
MTANTFALKAIAARIATAEYLPNGYLPNVFNVGDHRLKLMIKKHVGGGVVYRYTILGIQLIIDVLEKDDKLDFVIVKDPLSESNYVSDEPKSNDLDDLKTLIAEFIREHTRRFNS